jgi:hypothetical protein
VTGTRDVVRRVRRELAGVSTELAVADRTDVPQVVVIASASRSGSSLLFHLLRSTGAFVSLDGEHSHLYRLYGLGAPVRVGGHDGSADRPTDDVADTFARELLGDTTGPELARPTSVDGFAGVLVRRLAGQWSTLLPPVEELLPLVRRHVAAEAGRDRFDPQRLLLDVLAELRDQGCPVNPWYYDIDARRIRAAFPGLARPSGPPVPDIVEEPPFIVPVPASPVTMTDLSRRPLLLKASVDAYRLPMLSTLFPKADIRVVHLVRNPAATVNGLIDGWLSHGFFSYPIPPSEATLDIDGYSHLPWGGSWWNFDLPPGWEEVRDASLPEVCATQWAQAHESILTDLAGLPFPVTTVRAERMLSSFDAQRRVVADLLAAVGAGPATLPRPAPLVMATERPRPARWTARQELLAPVIRSPRVVDLARRLDLGGPDDGDWT